MTGTRVKLLEQHLAKLTASLAIATDKDGVRRQIKAVKARLREERKSA